MPLDGHAEASSGEAERAAALYTLGYSYTQQLGRFGLGPSDRAWVIRGAMAALAGTRPPFNPAKHQNPRRTLEKALMKADKGRLDAAAREPGAQKFVSGLVYRPIKEGTGGRPSDKDIVVLHFKGMLSNGKEFENTYRRGQPASFDLRGGVIPCWVEGLPKMKVGGSARITCPSELAFKDEGYLPQIPPHELLWFDVELLGTSPGGPSVAIPNYFPLPWTPTIPDGGLTPQTR